MVYESNSLDINDDKSLEFDSSTYNVHLIEDFRGRTFYVDGYTENFVLWI